MIIVENFLANQMAALGVKSGQMCTIDMQISSGGWQKDVGMSSLVPKQKDVGQKVTLQAIREFPFKI